VLEIAESIHFRQLASSETGANSALSLSPAILILLTPLPAVFPNGLNPPGVVALGELCDISLADLAGEDVEKTPPLLGALYTPFPPWIAW
jgi:hypothetical protein